MSRPMAAVRAALQLSVRAGVVELLRRLSVVCIEDCILHPLLPFLVWMTAVCSKRKEQAAPAGGGADKGDGRQGGQAVYGKDGAHENSLMAHPPSVAQLTAVLRVVFDLAVVAIKDDVGRSPATGEAPLSLSYDCERWSDVQRAHVKALLLRAHMGGMGGDMDMMRAAAQLWTKRFAAESRQPQPSALPQPTGAAPRAWQPFLSHLFEQSRAKQWSLFSSVAPSQLSAVADDDVLLSAIDQHCSPLIDRLRAEDSPVREAIQQRVKEKEDAAGEGGEAAHVDVVQLLSGLIWRYRSRTSNKRPLLPTKGGGGGGDGCGEEDGEEDEEAQKDRRLFERIKGEVDHISRRIVAHRIVRAKTLAGAGRG